MPVEHDRQGNRFTIQLGAYHAALMYARRGDTLDLYHIYVPDPYRNRGHAGRLLNTAFDYARSHGLTVVPTCPFIRDDYLPRNPQHHDLITQGEFPFANDHDAPDAQAR